MAFNTNNFMQPKSLDLPAWVFDSGLEPPPPLPPPLRQPHHIQYAGGFLAQKQQQVARLRYRQQLQYQQQQQQIFENLLDMPQTGGHQWSQLGGFQQLNQKQRHARMYVRTPHPGAVQKSRTVHLQTTQHPAKLAALARAEAAEAAERARLMQEERQERKEHAERKDELKKDPSANYRHYKEYLEYFPLSRGERPNDYLLGLLANQRMPAEPTSDMGLAIQYAKRHWENAWGMKDLDYVVGMAKNELEKKKWGSEGSRALG